MLSHNPAGAVAARTERSLALRLKSDGCVCGAPGAVAPPRTPLVLVGRSGADAQYVPACVRQCFRCSSKFPNGAGLRSDGPLPCARTASVCHGVATFAMSSLSELRRRAIRFGTELPPLGQSQGRTIVGRGSVVCLGTGRPSVYASACMPESLAAATCWPTVGVEHICSSQDEP